MLSWLFRKKKTKNLSLNKFYVINLIGDNYMVQFLKFGIVGIFNTLINIGIYIILVSLGINYLLSNLIHFWFIK